MPTATKTKAAKANPTNDEPTPVESSAPVSDVALIDQSDAFETKWAPLIKAKQQAGLSREQALTAIKNQIREDAANGQTVAADALAALGG